MAQDGFSLLIFIELDCSCVETQHYLKDNPQMCTQFWVRSVSAGWIDWR